MAEKMSKKDILSRVLDAYNKLDEADSELRRVETAVEEAKTQVNDAFKLLEEIPTEVEDIEDDAKDE
jgi:DNA repair ATPase RecN